MIKLWEIGDKLITCTCTWIFEIINILIYSVFKLIYAKFILHTKSRKALYAIVGLKNIGKLKKKCSLFLLSFVLAIFK